MADPVTTGLVVAGALGVAKQAEDFIAAASGHPGESIGTILGNLVDRRFTNAQAVSAASHLILLNIGVKPSEVPLNILQPVLDGASLQEDPYLQETWANLLANAADPRQANPVLPVFATMLKDLTAREVTFLEHFVTTISGNQPNQRRVWAEHKTMGYTPAQLMDICSKAKILRYQGRHSMITVADWKANEAELTADDRDFTEMVDILKRNGILDEINRIEPLDVIPPVARAIETKVNSQKLNVETRTFYKLSELGTAFVNACRPPAKSEQA